jgi:hypothetical protein
MKKLLSILLLSFFLFNQFFAQTNNDIVVFAEDPLPFYVVLNGVKQNEKAETNVKIAGLNIERASLKVIFEDNTIAPISKNIWLWDTYEDKAKSNMIVTLRIVKTKKAYKLKWFSDVEKNNVTTVNSQPPVTQTAPTPPTQTFQNPPPTQTVVKETVTTTTTTASPENANVNVNMGGAGISMSINVNDNSTQPVQQPSNSDNVSFNMNVNVNDNMDFEDNANVSMNMNVNDGMGVDDNMNMNVSGSEMGNVESTSYSSSTTTTTTTTSTGWNGDTQSNTATSSSSWGNTEPNSSNVSNTYNDCEVQNINSVLSAIENESFKSDKMMVAKQATKKKCLSVDQIKQVMEKFTFEESKLEFAKIAYDNCLNKDDYYMVNESFTFSSSKSEMNDYISNH